MTNYSASKSEEKIKSHKKINKFLFPWINFYKFNPSQPVTVITMPSNSGIHETQILNQIKNTQITLRTFDKNYTSEQTNIVCPPNTRWEHKKADIFKSLNLLDLSGHKIAVWFDFCGSLSDEIFDGINSFLNKRIEGLFFITLETCVFRGLKNNSQNVYSYASGAAGKIVLTDALLQNSIVNSNKSVKILTEPYSYSRKNHAVFTLFSYEINNNK